MLYCLSNDCIDLDKIERFAGFLHRWAFARVLAHVMLPMTAHDI